MKIKYNWITLIITAAASLILGVWRAIVTNNGGEFFLDKSMYSVVIFGLIIAGLVVGAVLTVLDRETPQNYEIGRNFFAGFFGLLVSVCYITHGILSFTSMSSLSDDTSVVLYMLTALLELAAGGVFLMESISSLIGRNLLKEKPLFTIVVPIMLAFRLIGLFFDYTKVSVQSSEMFDIVAVALAALFMYYHAVMFAELKKSCIKSLFFFGAPMICAALASGADVAVSAILAGEFSISSMIMTVSDMLLCLYTVSLLAEITSKAGKQYLVKQEAEQQSEKPEKHELEVQPESSDDNAYVSFEDISSFGKSAPHIRRETVISEPAAASEKSSPEAAAHSDELHAKLSASLEQEKLPEEKPQAREKLEETEAADTDTAGVSFSTSPVQEDLHEEKAEEAPEKTEPILRAAHMSDVSAKPSESIEAKPKRAQRSGKPAYTPTTDGVDMDRINRLLLELENEK